MTHHFHEAFRRPMQPFVLYNSEQRKKVEFVPRKEGHIDMYVCGMTVYDYCHIGHARVMVAFDYIIRFLRSQGWNVNYVRNITDIDDKIIARANENGESITALTDHFITTINDAVAHITKYKAVFNANFEYFVYPKLTYLT